MRSETAICSIFARHAESGVHHPTSPEHVKLDHDRLDVRMDRGGLCSDELVCWRRRRAVAKLDERGNMCVATSFGGCRVRLPGKIEELFVVATNEKVGNPAESDVAAGSAPAKDSYTGENIQVLKAQMRSVSAWHVHR